MGVQKLKVRSLVALMRRYFLKVAVDELVRVLRLRANIIIYAPRVYCWDLRNQSEIKVVEGFL